MRKYEFLEHPADIKLRAYGKDLVELFTNAVSGMMEFLYGNNITGTTQNKTTKVVSLESENVESLLVDWLAEILWLSETQHAMCVIAKIDRISNTKIHAQIRLIIAKAKDDIKAVTYHELNVKKLNEHWEAEVVFDV